jgi:hypothetical protein
VPLLYIAACTSAAKAADTQYSQSPQRPMRSLNLHEFFNFVRKVPSSKRQQLLTFYAFTG